jgi:transposase
MDKFIRIGIDLSKRVFQVHGLDTEERPVRKTLRRSDMERYFGSIAPSCIGMEACGSAHYWARVLTKQGHEVKLLPPQYVKPYVKRGKNDAADAEAICEAMSRPAMRFVPVKSAENQAALMLHGARDLLIKQRTMLINAVRGHAGEFGVTAPLGVRSVGELTEKLAGADIPELARSIFAVLIEQLGAIKEQIRGLEKRLMAWHRHNELSRRLATIDGIGPITASALAMKVPEPTMHRSSRHFAAWIGLTPKDHSTAGRQRNGGITRAGDQALRSLLVNGAMAVIRQAKPGKTSPWLLSLLNRKPKKLAAVALANKMARIAWVVMTRGEIYRRPGAA